MSSQSLIDNNQKDLHQFTRFQNFHIDVHADRHGGLATSDKEFAESVYSSFSILTSALFIGKTLINMNTVRIDLKTLATDNDTMHIALAFCELLGYFGLPLILIVAWSFQGWSCGKVTRLVCTIIKHLSGFSLLLLLAYLTTDTWKRSYKQVMAYHTAGRKFMFMLIFFVNMPIYVWIGANAVLLKVSDIQFDALMAKGLVHSALDFFSSVVTGDVSKAIENTPTLQFIMVLNQLVSVTNSSNIRMQQTMAIFFGGPHAKMNAEETNESESYLNLVYDRICRCGELNIIKKMLASLCLDHEGVQKLMLHRKDPELGHHSSAP